MTASVFGNRWPTIRLRFLFDLRREDPLPKDEIVTAFRDGQVTLRLNRREEGFTNAVQESGYQRIYEGDLAIHAMDAFAGAIGVSESTGKCSPVCQVLVPRAHVDARFIAYFLRHAARSGYIQSLARGIRERSTDFRWAVGRNVRVPAPELRAQVEVADFLDEECERINQLGSKLDAVTRRTDELLHTELGEVVSDRLTDSDIRLGRLLIRSEQGWSPECEARPPRADEWGVLRAGAVNAGIYRPDDCKTLPRGLDPMLRYEVKPGDVLMCRASGSPQLIGSVAYIEQTPPRRMLCDKLYRLTFDASKVLPEFVPLLLATPSARGQIEKAISGGQGMANNLPLRSVRDLRVGLPSVEDQGTIIDLANRKGRAGRRMKAVLADFQQKSDEYQQALITEAVTGQLDVSQVGESEMEERLLATAEANQ